jgi:hypothetical protein
MKQVLPDGSSECKRCGGGGGWGCESNKTPVVTCQSVGWFAGSVINWTRGALAQSNAKLHDTYASLCLYIYRTYCTLLSHLAQATGSLRSTDRNLASSQLPCIKIKLSYIETGAAALWEVPIIR